MGWSSGMKQHKAFRKQHEVGVGNIHVSNKGIWALESIFPNVSHVVNGRGSIWTQVYLSPTSVFLTSKTYHYFDRFGNWGKHKVSVNLYIYIKAISLLLEEEEGNVTEEHKQRREYKFLFCGTLEHHQQFPRHIRNVQELLPVNSFTKINSLSMLQFAWN